MWKNVYNGIKSASDISNSGSHKRVCNLFSFPFRPEIYDLWHHLNQARIFDLPKLFDQNFEICSAAKSAFVMCMLSF